MTKYKVTNRLGCNLNIGSISFKPKETKELDFKPTSDRFIIEKIDMKGETNEVPEKNELNRRKK